MTLNRKSQGQGHRERLQFGRSHQGLFPCKVSSLYWLMWLRMNLNAEVNQNVDRRTDRQTDRQTSSIHKPELLCNPAKNLLTTRAPRGTDRSPEYNEHFCYKLDSRVKNLTTEWNQKQQHFITHASRSLLWIRFVAVAFRSEEEVFLRRGPPPLVTYFCLALDLPLGKYCQNILHVPGYAHFIPTKFRKHPLSGSVVKAGYVFPYIYMH